MTTSSGQAANELRAAGRALDPGRFARTVRRATLPLAVVAGVVFFLCFGSLRVPAGMDSMPEIPPGSLCLIDKRAGSARPGKEVFVDLPDGGTLLTRLVAIEPDGSLRVRNDSAATRLPDSDDFGALPASALRGTVLVVFRENRPEVPRGR